MRFVSYASEGRYHVGLLGSDERALRPVPGADGDEPTGLLHIIDNWSAYEATLSAHDAPSVSLDAVELLAPIPTPRRNIFCVGKNYTDHAKEFGLSGYDHTGDPDAPEKPIIFTKAPSTVIAPGVPIESHASLTRELDYEAELAVIIGKGGRSISRAAAMDHVWGYTIVNDVTARDLQRDHRQWFLGKSLDGFCPMGPWAVTADEIDLDALEISCTVNGELRQSAKTSSLIFDVPTLIETLSAGITLEPGDIVATGTPEGVGIGFNPPKFLATGDEIRIQVTGLGTLCNVVG